MDIKAKVAALIGLLVGIVRMFFPGLDGSIETHLLAILDTIFFAFAFVARGGLTTVGLPTKTRITAVIAGLAALARGFINFPVEVEQSLQAGVTAAYMLIAAFLQMAGEKTATAK